MTQRFRRMCIGFCAVRPYLRFRLIGLLSLLALTAGYWASSASAQATNAQMSGRVVDPTGAVIPNATIDVQNTGTGLARTVTSSESGEYVIPSLPVGAYRLKAVAAGFKTYTQSGIVLEGGQQARLDVTMQIGSTSETVQVDAQALQVDTSSASIRTEVDSTQLKELPLNTRDTLQLVTLVPGVGNASTGVYGQGASTGAASNSMPSAVTDQRSGPMFTVNGNRVNSSELSLDGAILVTALYNRPANLPNPDSIGEFSLLTNNFGAEYGHASGGAFVAITKSGTNTFHGSAWEFLRNDALNARNWFAPAPAVKPILKQNQFGVAFGGPVLRDKAFFFATYEGMRIHQVALQNFPSLTPAERTGDFSAVSTQLTDPSTGLPYPNNQIPQSEWDPLSLGFMNTYMPVANPTTGLFAGQYSSPIIGDQFTGRADYRTTKRDLTYVRFFRINNTQPTFYSNNVSWDSFSNVNQGITVRDTHTFTPNLIGDIGYSDTNLTTNGTQQGKLVSPLQMGGTYSIQSVSGHPMSPLVNIAGIGAINSGWPDYENSALKQIDLKLSWAKGKHLWRFGFLGFHEAENLNYADNSTAGEPTFSGSITGNSLADFLIGRPVSFYQRTPYVMDEKGMTYGMYVQDDFRVSSRLTLNLGMRYDLAVPWTEAGLHSSTVVFSSSFHSTRFPSAAPGMAFAGDPGIPDGLMFMDKTDFAPRLGFAYDVFGDGKTAIRGGYGIFYNPPGSITLENTNQGPPFSAVMSFYPNTFSDPYGTTYTDPFPYTLNPSNPFFVYPAEEFAPDPHIKNAFVQQFNLNVQHEFPKDFMVQAGYVGSLGDRLWYGHEVNYAPYAPGATAANAQSRRLFEPQYFADIARTSDIGYSNYNSLQVTARKRLSAGYTMQLAYTFSKSLDTGSYPDSDSTTLQDPSNPLTGEYARSDFNQKQLFRLNGVWDLPQFKNLGLMRYAIGGWELAGILNYSSGTPFSVNTGSEADWLGPSWDTGNLRLNQLHGACVGCGNRKQWTTTGYFDPTAYVTPPYGTFGNSGRNSLTGPAYFDTDMSFVKNFPFLKRAESKINFRADIFNLFNNVPLNNPANSNSSPVFGQITSAGNAREVQLALRLEF
jgi:Carboxypeptidase regulatory-like domain/TonB dependent receptor